MLKKLFGFILAAILPCVSHAATITDKIITCGYNTIAIYDPSSGTPVELWSYSPDGSTRVGYSECRMINNNTQILATSSFSGVDIIDVATKTVTAHWDMPYAHSAALLPMNKLLVASEGDGTTNSPGAFYVYNASAPGSTPLSTTVWGGAHTILTNNDRDNTFWIMNSAYVAKFSVFNLFTSQVLVAKNKTATLTSTNKGAHDATFTQDGSKIIFSDIDDVYTFDPTVWQFVPYASTPMPNVKSLDVNKNTGLLMYSQPPNNEPGTTKIKFGDGTAMTMPTGLYKARWVYGDLPASTTTPAATTSN